MPTNVCLVKAMVFPVLMYGCESWTVKKAECQRIDAFELLSWRRLLRFPWTARKSNQSILKEIIPEYSLEGLMLKLKLQYFGHLMQRTDSFDKILMLGNIEGGRRRGWQRMRWLDGISNSVDMSWVCSGNWWWMGKPGMLQSMGSQSQTRLSDWTEIAAVVFFPKTSVTNISWQLYFTDYNPWHNTEVTVSSLFLFLVLKGTFVKLAHLK